MSGERIAAWRRQDNDLALRVPVVARLNHGRVPVVSVRGKEHFVFGNPGMVPVSEALKVVQDHFTGQQQADSSAPTSRRGG